MQPEFAVWRVEGFDGSDKLFSFEVPAHSWLETDVRAVLQRLVARTLDLDADAFAQEVELARAPNSLSPLSVKKDAGARRLLMRCGDNPYFTAAIF
jgi:hypothetical protein